MKKIILFLLIAGLCSAHVIENNPESPVMFQYANTYEFTVQFDNSTIDELNFFMDGETMFSYPNSSIVRLGNRFRAPVLIGILPGNHTIEWVANTSGVLQNANFSYVILQQSYDTPIDLAVESDRIELGDMFTITVNFQPTGLHWMNQTLIKNITLELLDLDTTTVEYTSTSFVQLGKGVFIFHVSTESLNIGHYMAKVKMITNESGLQQTAEASIGLIIENNRKIDIKKTWYLPNEGIFIDAIYLSKDGQPIAGADCNVSLIDTDRNTVFDSEPLSELSINGVSHYVLNTSFDYESTFHGQIECAKDTPKSISKFYFQTKNATSSETQIRIRLEIERTKNLLLEMLEEKEMYDQEEVFLITDAFSEANKLLRKMDEGIDDDAAVAHFKEIQNTLNLKVGKIAEETLKPKASAIAPDPVNPKKSGFGYWWLSLGIALIIIILNFRHKKKDEFS